MTSSLQQDILALYDQLDAEIAQADPECRACGECCDFPEQEHVLYATTVETELALAQAALPAQWPDRRLCPFHEAGRCTNRSGRPLGCRAHFCDPGFREAGIALYARRHDRLKDLIERDEDEYRYAPFLELLAEAWPDG